MRGLKNMETPILKGVQIYHNYIRPHGGLDNEIPAEAAGITVEAENKWLMIIQNASRPQAVNNSKQSIQEGE
jgi:putative transposase